GNPAVMEKVRIDTEVRKLDQLRAAHVNQQYEIAKAVRGLPEKIRQSYDYSGRLAEDILMRNSYERREFAMAVGKESFTGKEAKEAAGQALIAAALAGKENTELRV